MAPKRRAPLGDLLSASQAAELLGVKRQRVYELVKEGRLPIMEIGGYKLIPRGSLDLYKKTRRVGRPTKRNS